jgi:hypothetical protein
MSPEGLLLTSMDEDGLLAVPLALDVGSHISLQVIRALNNPPTPRRRPCACDPRTNIVRTDLEPLVLAYAVDYPPMFRHL